MDCPQLPVSWLVQLFTKGLTSVKCACISQDKLRTSTHSHTIRPAHEDSDVKHFPIPVLLKKHFIFSCVFRRLTRGSWIHQSKVILFIYNKCFWLHSLWPFRQHFIKKPEKPLIFSVTTSYNLSPDLFCTIQFADYSEDMKWSTGSSSLETWGLPGNHLPAEMEPSPANAISYENRENTLFYTHWKYIPLRVSHKLHLWLTSEWSLQVVKALTLNYLWWLKCT